MATLSIHELFKFRADHPIAVLFAPEILFQRDHVPIAVL